MLALPESAERVSSRKGWQTKPLLWVTKGTARSVIDGGSEGKEDALALLSSHCQSISRLLLLGKPSQLPDDKGDIPSRWVSKTQSGAV